MAETCPTTKTNCHLEHRVELLEWSNKNHGETHKEIFSRLNALEKENAVQVEQYNSIIKEISALTASHNVLNEKLSALEAKPGKRWESIVEKIIWAVCAAVIAFLLARIGL